MGCILHIRKCPSYFTFCKYLLISYLVWIQRQRSMVVTFFGETVKVNKWESDACQQYCWLMWRAALEASLWPSTGCSREASGRGQFELRTKSEEWFIHVKIWRERSILDRGNWKHKGPPGMFTVQKASQWFIAACYLTMRSAQTEKWCHK